MITSKNYHYLRLSPIVGSSPEPSADQNQSSPSRIPRSKSQPPSRYATPNASRAPSRAASRNVSRNQSRSASRESSPSSTRSPSKIPRTSSSYRNASARIGSSSRITSAKPKVLPKPNNIGRSVTITKNKPVVRRKELSKLKEQSSIDSIVDDDELEDWNEPKTRGNKSKSVTSIQSRLDRKLESRPSVTSWTSHKFNMYVNTRAITSKNTSESIPESSAKETKGHIRESVKSIGTEKHKKVSVAEEIVRDEDILSVTIDSDGEAPTTELLSGGLTITTLAHVKTRLSKSRESIRNQARARAAIQETPSSRNSSKKISEASTTAAYDRQQSSGRNSATQSIRGSIPGSTTHSVRQSTTGRPSTQGSNPGSVHSSATHTYKQTPPSTTHSKTSIQSGPKTSRQNSQGSEDKASVSSKNSVTPSQAKRSQSRQSSTASVSSNESAVSVISNRPNAPATGTQSRISTAKKMSSASVMKSVGQTMANLDRMKSGLGSKAPTPDSEKRVSRMANLAASKKSVMDAMSMASTLSEKAKQSRTVVVDEVKPIKITVKEKGSDIEVQSGNVSMPRSATNGISP